MNTNQFLRFSRSEERGMRSEIAFRLLMLFLLIVPESTLNMVQAQTEPEAFYIYQNDGHFDGFFYDEVEKISYSRFDTLGVEHDDFISQEIVTPDSTYRIMLSAIDSIGFQQPEVIFNPDVKNLPYDYEGVYGYLCGYDLDNDAFYVYSWIPENRLPKIGDVYKYDGDTMVYLESLESTWAGKVVSITLDRYNDMEVYKVQCKFIEDISDIIKQLILVEEYSQNNGNVYYRRVAGIPELNVGQKPRKASGEFTGDIFSFSINAHIPIASEDYDVSIDPTIEASLNLKAVWKIPVFGSKYIGITTTLNCAASVGLSLSGKIAEFGTSGVGGVFGQIPIPAACPLFVLDVVPDVFFGGEANVKLSVTSPKVSTSLWQKWEIVDWWPRFSMGFGKSKEDNETPKDPSNQYNPEKTVEFSGYVQAGLEFPMKLKSLPLLKKIFNSELGGTVDMGPKLSAKLSINYSDKENIYDIMKNSSLTFGLLDADYKIEAKVKTLLSGEKKWTVLDGTLNVLPSIECAFAPEFGQCEEYYEERITDDGFRNARVFAFEPTGNVVKPMEIGVMLEKYFFDDGVERWSPYKSQKRLAKYYQLELLDGHDRSTWPKFVMPRGVESGRYRVRPFINFAGVFSSDNYEEALANPTYEFYHGAKLAIENDQLLVNYDGTTKQSATASGNCDTLLDLPNYLQATGSKGDFNISSVPDAFIETSGKNYHPTDTIVSSYLIKGQATIDDETFTVFPTEIVNGTIEPKSLYVHHLPNKTEDPVACTCSSIGLDVLRGRVTHGFTSDQFTNKDFSISRVGDSWQANLSISAYKDHDGGDQYGNYENLSASFSCSFLFTPTGNRKVAIQDATMDVTYKFDKYDENGEYRGADTYSSTFNGSGWTSNISKDGCMIFGGEKIKMQDDNGKFASVANLSVCFQEYVDAHPELVFIY